MALTVRRRRWRELESTLPPRIIAAALLDLWCETSGRTHPDELTDAEWHALLNEIGRRAWFFLRRSNDGSGA